MKKVLFILLGTLLMSFSCEEEAPVGNPLKMVLESKIPEIKAVIDQAARYELQIRYTQINHVGDRVQFADYDFDVVAENYFYPASTVKFPIAALALEKLNSIDSLNRNTRFFVEGDTTESTFAEDIIKVFTISDNNANNRLFEFLGQDAINASLRQKGISPVRIAHRLGTHTDEVETRPLIIYLNDSTTTTTSPIINTSPHSLALNKISKGVGYYEQDSLYRQPFDFSLKNYYPIEAQQAVLKRIVFPEFFAVQEQFHLSEDQRDFLLNAMQMLPREAGYDTATYYDSYCKFFLFGDSQEKMPEHIKIYNKVGFAYGTITDCAYITDRNNEVEFMLTATLLVNKDGIFNDDMYEYDEIGIPFLAELGRQLYTYELNRKK